MKEYISKDTLVREIEKRRDSLISLSESCPANTAAKSGFYAQAQTLEGIKNFIDTLEVKAMDLIDRKTDWSPSKKQMESLKDMLKWNIGDFNYQKWMEVNSLYEDLTNSKLFDETDRQK